MAYEGAGTVGVSDRMVYVSGATFVESDPDGDRYSRYIQWHDVFRDLGVAAAGRIVIEPG